MKRQLFQRQRFGRLETPLWSPTMNYRGGSVSEGFARTLLGLRSLPMTLSSFCRSLFLLLVMYFFLSLFLSEPQWPPHHTTIPTFSNTSLLVSTIIFNISVCSVYKYFSCVYVCWNTPGRKVEWMHLPPSIHACRHTRSQCLFECCLTPAHSSSVMSEYVFVMGAVDADWDSAQERNPVGLPVFSIRWPCVTSIHTGRC